MAVRNADPPGAAATEQTRAQAAEVLLAPLASPALTGNPTVPTQAYANSSTRAASTAFVAATVPQIGTHANRPAAAAGNANVLYYETDTGLTFVSDGSAWQTIKPGGELGYAQTTSIFSTASTAFVDVTGLTTTVTTGVRPVRIILDVEYCTNTTNGGGLIAAILEDGVVIAQGYVQPLGTSGATTQIATPLHREARRTPSAASHTYKIQLKAVTSGTAFLVATAADPAFIQVIEC